MTEKLKPCPFCGGEAELSRGLHIYANWGVWCPSCEFSTGARFRSRKEASDAWNTRAERTCRRVPGKMHYGERRPKCSECGYGLGDSRWLYCPKCGSLITEKAKNENEL